MSLHSTTTGNARCFKKINKKGVSMNISVFVVASYVLINISEPKIFRVINNSSLEYKW